MSLLPVRLNKYRRNIIFSQNEEDIMNIIRSYIDYMRNNIYNKKTRSYGFTDKSIHSYVLTLMRKLLKNNNFELLLTYDINMAHYNHLPVPVNNDTNKRCHSRLSSSFKNFNFFIIFRHSQELDIIVNPVQLILENGRLRRQMRQEQENTENKLVELQDNYREDIIRYEEIINDYENQLL